MLEYLSRYRNTVNKNEKAMSDITKKAPDLLEIKSWPAELVHNKQIFISWWCGKKGASFNIKKQPNKDDIHKQPC
jgi:hypothetical protein